MSLAGSLAGRRVAVTGATGFLGRYVVRVLAEHGAQVVGVVRNPERVPALQAAGVEMRRADLADRAALAAGFRDVDAIVSNAALYSLSNRNWAEHERANVQGTCNVFDAAADAGVRRIVHVSSAAIYGFGARGRIDEDHALLDAATRRLPHNIYPLSKALSEREAWRLAGVHGMALTTVRPSAIYGAFDPNLVPVFRRVLTLPVTVVPVFLRISFVYAGDVAEGIALALEQPQSVGRAYNLTGDRESAWELAGAWRAAGGPTGRVRLPLPVPWRLDFDNGRARRELGWHVRPMVDAWRETFRLEGEAA